MATPNTEFLPLAEGKTKIVTPLALDREHVRIFSKDDLTAGDGKKHDVIEGKGKLANQTTCNVFSLLKDCDVPVAFVGQCTENEFIAERCSMYEYEVVVRRKAFGSFLKRYPGVSKGHVFPQLKLEFFLKTSGKKWKEHDLPVDDPLIIFDDGRALLYRPDQPKHQQEPFLILQDFPLKDSPEIIGKMCQIATQTFLILEKAWHILDREMVDFKVEFGHNESGDLRLADVIDNDSWRVLKDGKHLDKQAYREDENLNEVTRKYQLVARLTERFSLPRQQIVLWRGSETDKLEPFYHALGEYDCGKTLQIRQITCSAHKQPVQAYEEVNQLVFDIPDTVILAYVGKSNALGPMLASQVSVPVISVPSGWETLPNDIWSSMNLPGSVSPATILNPKSAVLFALQSLAMRNPKLYAQLRIKQEPRLCNFIRL